MAEERLLLSNVALLVRIQWLGSSLPGTLHLTNKRVVFTQWGWLTAIKKADLYQIQDVEVAETRPLIAVLGQYWILRIKADKRELEFAFFGRPESQRKRADEWQEAIRQWAAKP